MAGQSPSYTATAKPNKPTTSIFKNPTNLLLLAIISLLCFASYLLGSYRPKPIPVIRPASPTVNPSCKIESDQLTLDFNPHHTATESTEQDPKQYDFPPCNVSYSEYTPCEDVKRSVRFDRERVKYRERHCPEQNEVLKCRIPAPFGYKNPFTWPASRDLVWYANVPHKELTIEKAIKNWIRFEGDRFRFSGGGTMLQTRILIRLGN